MRPHFALATALLLSIPPLAAAADREPLANLRSTVSTIEWEPVVDHGGMHLRVSLPDGSSFERDFPAGANPVFDVGRDGRGLDGTFTFEITITPRPLTALRRLRDASPEERAAAVARLRAQGELPNQTTQSGSFAVRDGQIDVGQGGAEPRQRVAAPSVAAPSGLRPIAAPDQVIADDLIVQGSACVGLDCVNNETFGFDTLRLKENNLRIKFDDTSTAAGFPNHDWQLTANDSASGGANKFSIEDITASTVPFTVSGNAPTNSIFVDASGRLGLRTATPVLDIHVVKGDTPALRFEQNASGGFTPQTWDVAGNEANFFVRDVTGGSRLPLRIRPGAPTSSIDVAASGKVGIGTASPATKLHVTGSDGTTELFVQETSATTAPRELMELRNNGQAVTIYKDTSVAQRWLFGTFSTSFIIDEQAHAGVEYTFGNTGNLTIAGTLTQNSDVGSKDAIVAVDPRAVLDKLAALPISTWHYKSDGSAVRHLGPMAQDFAATFGLGQDDRHVAPLDVAGVGLAAIQGLQRELADRDARIQALEDGNAALDRRLAEIEQRLRALAPQP